MLLWVIHASLVKESIETVWIAYSISFFQYLLFAMFSLIIKFTYCAFFNCSYDLRKMSLFGYIHSWSVRLDIFQKYQNGSGARKSSLTNTLFGTTSKHLKTYCEVHWFIKYQIIEWKENFDQKPYYVHSDWIHFNWKSV